jgi:hypothetical protein
VYHGNCLDLDPTYSDIYGLPLLRTTFGEKMRSSGPPTYYNAPVKKKIQIVFIQQDNLISILKNTPLSFGIYAVITFIDESLATRRTTSLIVMSPMRRAVWPPRIPYPDSIVQTRGPVL